MRLSFLHLIAAVAVSASLHIVGMQVSVKNVTQEPVITLSVKELRIESELEKQSAKNVPLKPLPAAGQATQKNRKKEVKDLAKQAKLLEQKAIQKKQYANKVLDHLNQHKRYPVQAKRRKVEGKTELYLKLDRTGKLLKSEVLNVSPYGFFNKETLAMVRRAIPLPKPGYDFQEGSLELHIPVVFTLKR